MKKFKYLILFLATFPASFFLKFVELFGDYSEQVLHAQFIAMPIQIIAFSFSND